MAETIGLSFTDIAADPGWTADDDKSKVEPKKERQKTGAEQAEEKVPEKPDLKEAAKKLGGIEPPDPAQPYYNLEPEKDFRARSQNYVRKLMGLGAKSQG